MTKKPTPTSTQGDPSSFRIDQKRIDASVEGYESDSAFSQTEAEREAFDAPRGQYEEKLVAFIDLLGFRQIVMRTATLNGKVPDSAEREKTRGAVHAALSSIPRDDYRSLFIPKYLDSMKSDLPLDVGVAGFSDTLIFWCDPRPETFGLLVHAIFRTVREFALKGFYCRGAVKMGEVLIDDAQQKEGTRSTPVMFGPAFIGAYDLEQKNAIDARIIFCNESTRFLRQWRTSAEPLQLRNFLSEYLFQSKDGPWQIDIFADFRKPQKDDFESLLSQAGMIKKSLEHVMELYTESPAVYRKLLAVVRLFNCALNEATAADDRFNAHKIIAPEPR